MMANNELDKPVAHKTPRSYDVRDDDHGAHARCNRMPLHARKRDPQVSSKTANQFLHFISGGTLVSVIDLIRFSLYMLKQYLNHVTSACNGVMQWCFLKLADDASALAPCHAE